MSVRPESDLRDVYRDLITVHIPQGEEPPESYDIRDLWQDINTLFDAIQERLRRESRAVMCPDHSGRNRRPTLCLACAMVLARNQTRHRKGGDLTL